jgi:chaperonin GroEL
MKKGIDLAVSTIVQELKKMSTPIQSKEQIKSIATISANGDQ